MSDQTPAARPSPPELSRGGITLLGRLVEASNATFLARREDGVHVVYKPVAGEAPLWDFPAHTLGRREVAAHLLSSAAGFDVVPTTSWLEDGPLGPGSVQEWVEAEGDDLADLVAVDEVPEGWFGIVVGLDADENEVALVHADHPGLRRLALFDAVVNNADRKAGHVIRVGERALGVDHGVTFHVEDKLRTILWGWEGEPLSTDEQELLLATIRTAGAALDGWLAGEEVQAVLDRAQALLEQGTFPQPGEEWPVIPWPPI